MGTLNDLGMISAWISPVWLIPDSGKNGNIGDDTRYEYRINASLIINTPEFENIFNVLNVKPLSV